MFGVLIVVCVCGGGGGGHQAMRLDTSERRLRI